jgi:hypothetical protein
MDPSMTDPAAPGLRATQPTWNDSFNHVDGYAEQLRVKLPLAPPGLTNGYMNVVPWIAIVFGILGILISLVALAGSTILGPLMVMFGSAGTGFALILGSLLSLVVAALEVAGGFMMLQRRATGWWLLALGMIVSLLTSLLHVSALGLIFWLLIAYIHLSVKPNYR